LKISIITGTYNSVLTISDTLKSIQNQSYPNIEHIIVDGASKDSTLKIVAKFPHVAKVISEPDQGIYDAMNKGIKAATGDIIGILNSDDFFPNDRIVQQIVDGFDKDTDCIFGDVAFVNPDNLNKIVRYYSAADWHPDKFKKGYMPPHPSFYVRKSFYEKLGLYQTDYTIAADYELLIRMLHKHKLNYNYLPLQIVTMRTGGVSTKNIKSRYILNKEIVRACAENDISTNMFYLSLKYGSKIFEYLQPHKKASL